MDRETSNQRPIAMQGVVSPSTTAAFPPEVFLIIFEYLEGDPATSTCLGLTGKQLYAMHTKIHHTISLHDSAFLHPGDELHRLLRKWVGPELVFSGDFLEKPKFMGVEKYKRMTNLFAEINVTQLAWHGCVDYDWTIHHIHRLYWRLHEKENRSRNK
jgi:hypothetical protein